MSQFVKVTLAVARKEIAANGFDSRSPSRYADARGAEPKLGLTASTGATHETLADPCER